MNALARVRLLTVSSAGALRPTAPSLPVAQAFRAQTASQQAPHHNHHHHHQVVSRSFATGQSVLSVPALKNAQDGSEVNMAEFFKSKRVVLFGVVGAFTPTCQNSHLPAYVDAVEELKEKRVDEIVCVTVNDRFVASAWAAQAKFGPDVKLLIDPDASFSKALGLDLDLSAAGLGVRSKRYSVLIEDGVIKAENVAQNPGAVENTGPDAILKVL